MRQPTFPTPVPVNVEAPAEGGNQKEKEEPEISPCGRLASLLENPISEGNLLKKISLKKQVHGVTGFFLDDAMEAKFLKSRLEGRRRGFLVLSLGFILIESLDWGLQASSRYETDIEITRKCLTLTVCIFLFFLGLFFWRSFHHLEKVVAGAMVAWVFCLAIVRDEILFGRHDYSTVCGNTSDLFFSEAAIMTLTTAFSVTFAISFPLRRPMLALSLGSVAVISIIAEVLESSVCRISREEVAVLFFFILCEVVVFGAVASAVIGEEYYLRVLLTKIGHQKTRIANLTEERDDMLKAKSGTSSAERLVNLIKEVAKGMRAMEKLFLLPENSGIEKETAADLSGSVRRMVKDLNEATHLASNAEQFFDVDIKGMMKRQRRRPSLVSLSRRRSFGSTDGLEGAEASSESGDFRIISFLNANFAKSSAVALNHTHHRRMSEVSDYSGLSGMQTVERRVSVMLAPVAALLPQSLAEQPREVAGDLSLSSEVREHWDLDLRLLQGVEVEGLHASLEEQKEEAERGLSVGKTQEGGKQALVAVRIRNALPIVGLHLLRPFLQDPLRLTSLRKLTSFLSLVESNYNEDAPYHNALHGADVASMTVWLTQQVGVRCRLSPLQNLTVVVAALCHDLGHDAVNNLFHTNSESTLALLYNDRSVLESFHCAQTFRILKDPSCNFLENVEKEGWKNFRSGLIDLILDTDMKGHFQFVSTLKLRTRTEGFVQCLGRDSWVAPESDEILKSMDSDVWLVTRACLKAADLGHSAKPWELHMKYSFAVTQEFFSQGDLENVLGLPVAPLCSRDGATPESLCKSQCGFLSFVCKEIFVELSTVEVMARTGGAEGQGETSPLSPAPATSPSSMAEGSVSCSRVASVCLKHLNDNVANWNDPTKTAPLVPASLFKEPEDKTALLRTHPAVARRKSKTEGEVMSFPRPSDKRGKEAEAEKGGTNERDREAGKKENNEPGKKEKGTGEINPG